MKLDRRSFLQKLGIGVAGVGAMSAGLNPLKEASHTQAGGLTTPEGSRLEAKPEVDYSKPNSERSPVLTVTNVGDTMYIIDEDLTKCMVYDGKEWVLVSTTKQET